MTTSRNVGSGSPGQPRHHAPSTSRPALEVYVDPATQRYRQERDAGTDRRKAKEAAAWAEIDALWQRQLDRDKQAQKGGRPKKNGASMPLIAPRDRDLRPRGAQ